MKISKALTTASLAISNFYWAGIVLAQEEEAATGTAGEYLPDSEVTGDLIGWIQGALQTVILLAALVCVAILIAAGYSYITAAGDEQKIEKATKTLTFAIVGLVICFISIIIVQFVITTFLS